MCAHIFTTITSLHELQYYTAAVYTELHYVHVLHAMHTDLQYITIVLSITGSAVATALC